MIYHSHTRRDSYEDLYTLDDIAKECRLTTADLKVHVAEFDVIVVTGLSGVLPAVPVSMRLKKPLAILRKQSDDTHQSGGLRFEGDGSMWVNGHAVGGCRVLWLDDFECSGGTGKRIRAAVTELKGKVVAQYMTRDRVYVELR